MDEAIVDLLENFTCQDGTHGRSDNGVGVWTTGVIATELK